MFLLCLCTTTINTKLTMSFADGLKNFGRCQWLLLQNHLNPSVPLVDFHSYSVLHAFEKWIQQNMDLF